MHYWLKMDHLNFVFSLMLIVSLGTCTFGSAIKAKNPNAKELEEVRSDSFLALNPEMAANHEEIKALSSNDGSGQYTEMPPNRQEIEDLLETSNYSDPRMNSEDQGNEESKRADPATVIAGATLAVDVLKDVLTAIGSVSRKIAIGIENKSGFRWQQPSHYFVSGTSDKNLPYYLYNGQAVVYTARKTHGSLRGAVGVVAFYVPSIYRTLGIMYSVPYNYWWHENWWNVKLYKGNTRANENMFDDLYYDANPFRANGWHVRDLGSICQFRGAMSSSGEATLEIHVVRK